MKSSLSDLLCYLVSGRGQNFYARILSALELQECYKVPAMAVGVRDRHYVLLFNPEWFKRATYKEVLFVVEHEAYHIVHEHIPRYLEYEAMATTDEQRMYLNLARPFAVDMAVNTFLEKSNRFLREHRRDFVLPDGPPQFNYQKEKSFDWYLSSLIDDLRKMPKMYTSLQQLKQVIDESQKGGGEEEKAKREDGEGSGEGDESQDKGGSSDGQQKPTFGQQIIANHDHWTNGENQGKVKSLEDKLSLADELRQKTKQVVRQAIDDHTKNRGTVPGELAEVIRELLKKPQVPFTQILRSWVVATQKYRLRRSITRMCRRHIGVPDFCQFPGSSKERKFTVVWMIDTSGSMGSSELEMGLNELRSLQRAEKDIEVIVIEADASVEHEYHLDKPNDKINYEVHGRGGTSFDPALIRAKELRPDIAFYFTDGYAPAPAAENRLSCPFAWIITPCGTPPDPNWGKVIKTREE